MSCWSRYGRNGAGACHGVPLLRMLVVSHRSQWALSQDRSRATMAHRRGVDLALFLTSVTNSATKLFGRFKEARCRLLAPSRPTASPLIHYLFSSCRPSQTPQKQRGCQDNGKADQDESGSDENFLARCGTVPRCSYRRQCRRSQNGGSRRHSPIAIGSAEQRPIGYLAYGRRQPHVIPNGADCEQKNSVQHSFQVSSQCHPYVSKMLLGQAGEKPNQEQSNSMEEKSSPIFHFRPAKFQYSPRSQAGLRQLSKSRMDASWTKAR
jgi:hypothetical protein